MFEDVNMPLKEIDKIIIKIESELENNNSLKREPETLEEDRDPRPLGGEDAEDLLWDPDSCVSDDNWGSY